MSAAYIPPVAAPVGTSGRAPQPDDAKNTNVVGDEGEDAQPICGAAPERVSGMIAPDIAAIPTSLTAQPRWLLWRNEVRKGKNGEPGKLTKVPKTARNTNASSTEAATWAPFAVIAAAFVSQPERFHGIGVVLGDLGDGRHFCGIDLDSCLDANSTLADWAKPFVALLMITFGETSPSGAGLKFFFLAAAADARELRNAFGFNPDTWGRKVSLGSNGKEHGPAVEIYIGPGRFFTVTGRQWPGSANEVIALDR
jgi:hypothetical protein